jgi:hypothetical protein
MEPLEVACIPAAGVGRSADVEEQPCGADGVGFSADRDYLLLGRVATAWLSSSMPPDYAAVVTVCAAYLWTKPAFLHTLVCELDMAMAEAETEDTRPG